MTRRDDKRLLDLLGEAMAATEPIPASLADDARAVFTWRTIDAELLALGFDSAVDELTGVRSASATARLLRFTADEVEIEVDVVDADLEGVITGADVSGVRLERPDGSTTAAVVDEHGRFRFEDVESGPLRLVIGDESGGRATEWFLV